MIIGGDFNSAPGDPIQSVGPLIIVPPYQQLLGAHYSDLWKLARPWHPGFTCCQAANLLNPRSTLGQRIDGLFIDRVPDRVRARRVGFRRRDRVDSGRWPSDHAGVVAKIRFEDGFDEDD